MTIEEELKAYKKAFQEVKEYAQNWKDTILLKFLYEIQRDILKISN